MKTAFWPALFIVGSAAVAAPDAAKDEPKK
jgi:hypothetical protein